MVMVVRFHVYIPKNFGNFVFLKLIAFLHITMVALDLESESDDDFMGGWTRNFFRLSFTYGPTPKSLANVPSPYLEYGLHCTFKSAEVASFVGGLLIRPIYMAYLQKTTPPEKVTPNTTKIIRAAGRKFQGRCLLASFVAGPFIVTPMAIWLNGYTRKALKKRCYEIRCDERSVFHSRSTLLLGWLGWYWKRFQGAVDFINIGTFYTAFRFNVMTKYTEMTGMAMHFLKEEDRYAAVEEAELDMRALTSHFLNKWRKKEMEEKEKGQGTENEQSN